MAGIRLVHVDHRHHRRVVEPQVFLDVLRIPVLLNRRDVIKGLGRLVSYGPGVSIDANDPDLA